MKNTNNLIEIDLLPKVDLSNKKVLLYGIGNPLRGDDRLGLLLAELIASFSQIRNINLASLTVEMNYQLNVEDAALISDFDVVIVTDASKADIDDFLLEKVRSDPVGFSMHAFTPGMLLQLCNETFNQSPEMYQLHIKGYKWNYSEKVSRKGKKNLEAAFLFLEEI
ncbi:MAG: hypothetical protein AAGI07_09805, partial [Bacteroidota bacterium]